MSLNDVDEVILSEDKAEQANSEGDKLKLVPVTESIRYRKRAQVAEKKIESLAEQLTEAKSETKKMAEQMSSLQIEHELIRKLTAAGAVDLETAVLIAKARIEGQKEADLDACVEQLRGEKQYLFASDVVTAKRTTGAKERMADNHAVLGRAAKKAATTGNRTDLQEYLKLRRNFI